MTKADLESYRRALLNLRTRLAGDVDYLTEQAMGPSGNGMSGHMTGDLTDLGADLSEQESTLSLLKNEEQVLQDIGLALRRMDEGTYGKCEECQVNIPKARLSVLPYTRHCVQCARTLEQRS